MQELSSKAPKPTSFLRRGTRIALWLMPLMVAFFLFYQANVLAKAAGCQLGETCMSGDGTTATYLGFAAFAVFIGYAIFLLFFFTWKAIKLILARVRPQ